MKLKVCIVCGEREYIADGSDKDTVKIVQIVCKDCKESIKLEERELKYATND
ncbi:MAG: hypothetical protein ACP5D6_06495 [Kosmotogaceae bacterium]